MLAGLVIVSWLGSPDLVSRRAHRRGLESIAPTSETGESTAMWLKSRAARIEAQGDWPPLRPSGEDSAERRPPFFSHFIVMTFLSIRPVRWPLTACLR